MKMIQDTYETLVFNDASQLPEGVIKLTSLTSDVAEQNATRQAIVSGRIQGYKIIKNLRDFQNGALYVNEDHGQHYLKSYRKNKEDGPKEKPKTAQASADNEEVVELLREILSIQKQTLKKLTSIDDFCAGSAIGLAQWLDEARRLNHDAPTLVNGSTES